MGRSGVPGPHTIIGAVEYSQVLHILSLCQKEFSIIIGLRILGIPIATGDIILPIAGADPGASQQQIPVY